MNQQITPDQITADPVTPVETVETVTEAPAAPEPELSEDDAMRAAYARAMGTEEEAQPAAPVEVELPPGLPVGLKPVWGKLDEEARAIIQKSQNELSGKLANQGRLVQQISPIRDVLVEAARDIPELQGMSPQQVASEVMHLARVNAEFKRDPVSAMLKFADQAGMRAQLAQALGVTPGQPQTQNFNTIPAKLQELEQKLAQIADPEYIQEQFSSITAQQRTVEEVTTFAATADHWGEVEADIPKIIPGVQALLGEQASAKDVLTKAYEIAMSIRFPQTPASAVAQPDRVQAAQQAKAVNLPNRQPPGTVALNENDAMLAAYHRAMKK